MSQKLYGHLLETMNVELTCVGNGVEAVQRALSATYDLILMDIEMPELDGLSAVRLLRGKGYLRSIVAVSARTDEADREGCLHGGCDDFLGKPVTREALATVVHRNKPEPLVSALLHEPGMMELIDDFVHGLPRTITRLEAAFGGHNLEELGREARLLKGEAGGIGFDPITTAAVAVEEVLKHGAGTSEVRGKLSELIRLCLAARPATSVPEEPAEPTSESEEGEEGEDAVDEQPAAEAEETAETAKSPE